MILGFFFVRPIPLPLPDPSNRVESAIDDDDGYGTSDGLGPRSPTGYVPANTSHTHLLSTDADDDDDGEPNGKPIELEEEEPLVPTHPSHTTQAASDYLVESSSADTFMLSPTRAGLPRHRTGSGRSSSSRRTIRSQGDKALDGTLNIHGKRLFTTGNFWLLFTISSLRETFRICSL